MSKSHRRTALRVERLEPRALLAAGMGCDHNAMLPEDANGSGDVTPLDALVVINEIARSARNQASNAAPSGGAPSTTNFHISRSTMADVNADGKATAVDALVVINRVGRVHRGGSLASRVPIEDRIHRLTSDIAAGSLPKNLDVTTAKAILAKLQSGKLPEVSDTNDDSNSSSGNGNSTIAAPPTNPVDDTTTGDNDQNNDGDIVDDTETGDDTETEVDTTTGETGDNSGTGGNSDPVDDVDTGTGDDSAPVDDGETGSGDNSEIGDCLDSVARLEHLSERLTQRLTDAGVSAEVIKSVSDAVTAAINAGKPLTRADVFKLLSDAGVDTTILQTITEPHGHHDPQDNFEHLSELLLKNGADPVVVDKLIVELKAAADAGTPLTREEIKAKIEALGLTLPQPQHPETPRVGTIHLGEIVGRIHAARDAFFASMSVLNR